jgi:quercetin dioxygenase-like cupin family protein
MKISKGKMISIAASVGTLGLAGVLYAQAPALQLQVTGAQRTIVQTADVSVPGREAVVTRLDIAPGGVIGWHTHPGDEIGYATDGELRVYIAGKPARTIKAGEGYVIPMGAVHRGENLGSVPVKFVIVYVVEKGKPLVTPAPAPA